METSKTDAEKIDTRSSKKNSPVSKSFSHFKPTMTSTMNKTAVISFRRIPKPKDVIMPKKTPIKLVVSPLKPMSDRKSSNSMSTLCNPKQVPLPPRLGMGRSNKSTQRGKRVEHTTWFQTPEQSSEKATKAASQRVAEKMKEKIRGYQTKFMRKIEVVKDDIQVEEGEYKLVGFLENNDGQLVTKSAQKVQIKCDLKTLEDFKKDMKVYIHNNLRLICDSLDQLKTSSGKGYNGLSAIEEVKKKLKMENSHALKSILKQIESFESCSKGRESIAKNSEPETKIVILMKDLDELKESLEESRKELATMKKNDEDNRNAFKKELEGKDKTLAEKQLEYHELKKRLESIEENSLKAKMSHKDLQEKCNNKIAEVEELKKRLLSCAQSNISQQVKELEYENKIRKLEFDLISAIKDLESRISAEHAVGDHVTQHTDELALLKTNLMNSHNEKDKLDKEVEVLKKEIEICTEFGNKLLKYKEKALDSESENHSLIQKIKVLESKIEANEGLVFISKEDYDDLNELKKSESEKTQQIKALEDDLTKSRLLCQQLKDKLSTDKKLLDLRSSLIESLQAKETSQRIHLEGLAAEVGQRNYDVQMLKMELLAKSEELQSLYSTVNRKKFEVARQNHMVRILQEGNERVQMLRVKQEVKIGQLEEEVAHLKQTISLYQEAVLPSNMLKCNLLTDPYWETGASDNLVYYADDRHRRRHFDVNVAKYEK